MKDIEPLKVTDLFKEDEYIIPVYQRNYSWEDDQIRALITDICDKDEQSEYYLGTLIVNKRKDGKFEVIDGQQRLTTLFLLLSFLNNEKGCNYDLTKVLSFDARKKSNKILSQYSKNEIIESDKNNTIVAGYTTIEKIFAEIPDDKIKNFKDNLEKTVIIRVPVPENVDLNHYFEVMNTRGEQLELHEIAKNKFIEVLYDKENNDDFDSKVAEIIWETCSNMNRYVQMNFLKEVRGDIFGETWDTFENKDFDEIVDKLKEKFKKEEDNNKKKNSKKNIFQSNNSIKQEYFLQEILDGNYTPIDDIEEDDETEEKDKKGYESIISFPNFLLQVNYLLMLKEEKSDNKENETENKKDEKLLDDSELLTHLKKYYKDKPQAKEFIFNMLKYRYYFDKYIVKRDYTVKDKPDGVWAIQRLNLYDKTAQPVGYEGIDTDLLTKLQASLRITYTSPKTMKWISEVLSKISEPENKEKILENSLENLERYCKEQLNNIKKNNPSGNPFGTGFQIPRIVFTYLDYILYRDNKEEFKDYDVKYRTSIEHFYPQNPKENKMDSEPLNNFGNLALITVSGNSTVSNFYPKAKYDQWKDSVIKQSPKLILMAEEFNKINDDKIVLEKYENCIKEHDARMRDILDKELK